MERVNRDKEGKIWAIGGGKGGTGKSFITSSIGTYLAGKGNKVVLIDVDIGGANLHTILGIKRPRKSLTDFFETKLPLYQLTVKTGIEDMYLITGDIHSLSSDNIKFFQKLRLFRHIMKLNTQYALIDLGSGSHTNTIDTFLIADKMIAVVEPEILSIENMYHFIKNALFRKVKVSLRAHGFREIVDHMWMSRKRYKIKNLKDLIDSLKGFSYIEDILNEELSDFTIYLILNKVRTGQDILVGSSIKSIFMKYLGIECQFVGYIEHDDSVWRSMRRRQPFMLNYASSPCTKEIETSTENLIKGNEIKLPRV